MSGLAFASYMVFLCSWFLHMPDRVRALGIIRFDAMLLALTLGLTLISGLTPARTAGEKRVRRWLLVLVLYVFATLPLVEWPGSVLRFGRRTASPASPRARIPGKRVRSGEEGGRPSAS